MNQVRVLDCTLRDGGYVNNWDFGKENIKKIIYHLIEANIDIIECGYISQMKSYQEGSTIYDSMERVTQYMPEDNIHYGRTKSKYRRHLMVGMINYGEYDCKLLPEQKESTLDGIRVAFHKKDYNEALIFCKEIRAKGYLLFIQPMVSVAYSDLEFIDLIKKANNLNPYAFYIVDSFGVIKKNEMMRLFYLVDHNLNSDINLGFHSHNNIQLSYSNAQALTELNTNRSIIIDSSVFGMGRGAGNLNTELFIDYLNDTYGNQYNNVPLLHIIDHVLNPIYMKDYWGYSLPFYISASHNCHPNYASYLDNKSTLTIENINEILNRMTDEKKINFDKTYIENLYHDYLSNKITDTDSKEALSFLFKNKTILILAPGRSIKVQTEKIRLQMNQSDTISIAVNFNPEDFNCNYIFISNLRRYEELKMKELDKLILTSNIKTDIPAKYIVNYSELLNNIEAVHDNSCMMLIKLLINLGVKHVKLAGLDGYSHNVFDNFVTKDMAFMKKIEFMESMNRGMEELLKIYRTQIHIEFVTDPINVK